jgi:hypothetical protein
MVILRATSNLGGQKEDKGMMCSITPTKLWGCLAKNKTLQGSGLLVLKLVKSNDVI